MRKLERRDDPYFLKIDMLKISAKLIIIFNLLPLSCLGSDYVIPNWQRSNGGVRIQKFDEEYCNGNKIQFNNSGYSYSLFTIHNSEVMNRQNNWRAGLERQLISPTEIIINFKDGSNLREIGIYAFQGNWSGFESKNISYGSSTGGYSLFYKEKQICYFDKYLKK